MRAAIEFLTALAITAGAMYFAAPALMQEAMRGILQRIVS